VELIVDRLEFEYSPGNKILDGISFRAESGDFISLIGRNGSGKSTLFKCILNRLNGYSGTVLVDNKDTRSLKKRNCRNTSPMFRRLITVFLITRSWI